MKPETQTFLDQLSRSTDAMQAAVADNCRFDERVALARWQQFETYLPTPQPEYPDWSEANGLHYAKHVTVTSTSIPDSFLDLNQTAWLAGIVINREVVRLEHLGYALEKSNLRFEQLKKLVDDKSDLTEFIRTWNSVRDGRPMFAAFYDEVQAQADHTDWQHQLRDRLGLGHYGSKAGVAVPVALMRYPLTEVDSRKVANAFALPTVLDGGMHEFFFPVPQTQPYGATVHLGAEQAATLTAEILHSRINYKPEHFRKIGLITRPHNLKDDSLRKARDAHLAILRQETDRADFAEFMAERI